MTTDTLGRTTTSLINAQRKAGKHIQLIDVRTPAEFRQTHADIAQSIPLDALSAESIAALRDGDPSEPLYIICRTGARGEKACAKLRAEGIENVLNVEGGIEAWEAEGLPVVVGKGGVSIERQVRIAAGSFVLIGVLLAWIVHPGFVALSAFVGGGLVFAGVTNTCGMGMLLTKMPWNRAGGCTTSCGS